MGAHLMDQGLAGWVTVIRREGDPGTTALYARQVSIRIKFLDVLYVFYALVSAPLFVFEISVHLRTHVSDISLEKVLPYSG